MWSVLRFLLVFILISDVAPRAYAERRAQTEGLSSHLPLAFEPNRGQAPGTVKFLSRGSGYRVALDAGGAALALRGRSTPAALRIGLAGGNPAAQSEAAAPLPGTASYLVGDRPEDWLRAIPTYARVRYDEVYPGVDVVYYGNQRELEFDFVVAPGTDPAVIVLDVDGARHVRLERGELVLEADGGQVRLRAPTVYQEAHGVRQLVDGRYVLRGGRRVGFRIGAYDRSRPLTIDPVLSYASYLAGSGDERAFALALDDDGSTWVAGTTATNDGSLDAFVVKLDATGKHPLYTAYVGGSGDEHGLGLAIDADGDAYLVGSTDSTDFPTAGTPLQPARAGGSDAFVAKLDASGAELAWATYFGGSADDEATSVAVGADGVVHVAGVTASADLAVPGAALQAHAAGGRDAFVVDLDASGSRLACGTYFGGSGDDAARAIALDASGAVVVTGETTSRDLPTANAMQPALAGRADGFVARLDACASLLTYATYLGGSGDDGGRALALGAAGDLFVAGGTASADFPTRSPAQASRAGGYDAFVAHIDPRRLGPAALVYATYLGGAGDDVARGVALGGSDEVYVTGSTDSPDFPTRNASQAQSGGDLDAFVARLADDGSHVLFATYLGAAGSDLGHAIAAGRGRACVAGETTDRARHTDALVACLENQRPRASDDRATTAAGTPVTVAVTADDTDPDGNLDVRTVRIVRGPSHGMTVVDPSTGVVTYTPVLGFDGGDDATYEVCDSDGACDTARLLVTVTATESAARTSALAAALPGDPQPLAILTISGTVFEDVNYGGGAGRTLAASGGVARSGVRVELYNGAGNFLASTNTNGSGNYSFAGQQDASSYTVRVASGTVTSSRSGAVGTLVSVQTFRTNASTGSAVADTARVGGEDPTKVDAGSNTTSATLASLTTASTTAQSITPVTVGGGVTTVSGVNFGFNFDTIVSRRDSGQGTLRQFLINAATLGGDASLAQSGSRKDSSNTTVALPSAKESSIFMIADGSAHAGLRAGLTNQLTSGVAVLTITTSLPQITGANATNTVIDGSTQTVNVGDTNSGQLGTGGTVGVGADGVAGNADDVTLGRVYRPEVQVVDGNNLAIGIDVQANDCIVRGISIYGFGTAANSDTNANIRIGNATNITGALIEQNMVGITASSFADPGAGVRSPGDNIRSVGADSGTVRNNLIAYSEGKGFAVEAGSAGWTIQNNEIRGNAVLNMHLDGIDVEGAGSQTATITGNLIADNKGVGVDSFSGGGQNIITDNTITNNGRGTVGPSANESAGVRLYGATSQVARNLIFNNYGAGVMVTSASTANTISKNSIYDNGQVLNDASAGPTNQIGIDLLAAADNEDAGTSTYVTVNDSGDGDGDGNGLLNYPILSTAGRTGSFVVLTGFARPGSIVELYVADVATGASPPAGWGEGRTFVASVTEGSASDTTGGTGTYGPGTVNGLSQGTDTTNRFTFTIPVTAGSVPVGSILTATATVSGATSEFSGNVSVTNANNAPVANNNSYSTSEDTPLTVAASGVLGNDTDANGDTLTAVLVTGPANGTLTLNSNGSFTYTPNANFNGSNTFTYRANDGTANSNVATVTITVTAVNDAPVGVNDSYATNEDTPLVVAAAGVLSNDTDVEGSGLNAVLVSSPANGSLTLNANGSFTYTPNANFNGTNTFTYRPNDGTTNGNVTTVTLTVNAVNDAPVGGGDSYTTAEDTPLVVAAAGVLSNDTDVEGSALNAVLVSGPSSGSLTLNANGSFSYTPNANFNGSDSFTYRPNDGTTNGNVTTVTLNVTAVNDAPVGVADSYTTPEDTPLVVAAAGVLTNDTDVEGSGLTAVQVSGPTHGSLTLNADGSFTYTPTGNYNGPDSFTYRPNDGTTNGSIATVTLTVSASNDTPVGTDDAYATPEDTPLVVAAPGVLVNDTDTEGSALTAILGTGPANGNLVLNADGSFTYTPNANFNGSDSFTYRPNDGTGNGNLTTVTLTVSASNDPPNAVDDAFSVAEDSGANALAALANDVSTPDTGETLTIIAVTQGTNGAVVITGGGTGLTYAPAANFNGSDSFTYTIDDGNGGTDTATVSVTVTNVNDQPTANDDSAIVVEDGGATAVDVLTNDTIAPDTGETLSITGVTQGASGTVTITGGGTGLTYAPNPDFFGSDSFTYTIDDGNGGTDTATVNVTVTNVNDPPAANDDSTTVTEDSGANAVDVLANDASTPDSGETLTIIAVTQGTGGTVAITGGGTGLTYTPNLDFAGSDSFTYTLSDGNGGSDTATVNVTVTNVNDPPTASDDGVTLAEDGGPTAIDVLANDVSAPDTGETLTIIAVTQGAHGTVAITGGGAGLTYTPAADYFGPDSFTYTIDDGNGGTDTATVTVNVTAVNDAPVTVDDTFSATEDGGAVRLDVLSNDSDVEGDPLTLTILADPAHGAVFVDDNGTPGVPGDDTIVYVSNTDFSGSDSFVYQVCDPLGACTSGTVTVNVIGENDPPVANDDSPVIAEDAGPTVIDVLANDVDADADPLTITIVGATTHGIVVVDDNGTPGDPSDDSVVYTPDADFAGVDSFTYQICDGSGECDSAVAFVTVASVNDAPTANDDTLTVAADSTATALPVLANDTSAPDAGETLSITGITQGANGTVTITGGGSGLTYMPNPGYVGPDSFTYTIDDGNGGSDGATVSITVNSPNAAPVGNPDFYAVPEDGTILVPGPGVLGNDTDADGNVLSAVLESGPATGSFAFNPDGSFTWTPDPDFDGVDTFTYHATDGAADSGSVTVTLTITASNDTPTANADVFSIQEDAIAVVFDVLVNDTPGPDTGDTLTVIGVSQGVSGTVAIGGGGAFVTYTPNPDFVGNDFFTYTIQDAGGMIATATVALVVAPVDDAPLARDDAVSVNEDGGPSPIAVLDNDEDADGNALILSVTAQPAHGTATVSDAGTPGDRSDDLVVYTPAVDFTGVDVFTYQVCDASALCDTADVTVTVAPINDAPAAGDVAATTEEGEPVDVDVRASTSDIDGDMVAIALGTQPAHGTATVDDHGTPLDPTDDTITYTPEAGFTGDDTFTYVADDGNGGTATATVTVTVTPGNEPPTAVIGGPGTVEGSITSPMTFDGTASFDTDGSVVSYMWDFGDGSPTDSTSGAMPSHTYARAGTYTVTLVVVDDRGASSTVAAVVTVAVEAAVDDRSLFVKRADFRIRWSKHAKNKPSDQFRIRGSVNPRHMRADLSGTTLTVRVNGNTVVAPVSLTAPGVYATPPGTSPGIRCKIKFTNGAYRCTFRKADLRTLIGLPNQSETGLKDYRMSLEIAGAGLVDPIINGEYQFAFKSALGKTTKGLFKYKKNPTYTGVYLSTKTRAKELRTGGFRIIARGQLYPLGARTFIPTGDITMTVGERVITIPLSTLVRGGASDALSQYTYSKALGAVPGLERFWLSNAKRGFKIRTTDPSPTAIPRAAGDAPLSDDLPIRIEGPTPDGPLVYDTVVEIRRASPLSKRWKR